MWALLSVLIWVGRYPVDILHLFFISTFRIHNSTSSFSFALHNSSAPVLLSTLFSLCSVNTLLVRLFLPYYSFLLIATLSYFFSLLLHPPLTLYKYAVVVVVVVVGHCCWFLRRRTEIQWSSHVAALML